MFEVEHVKALGTHDRAQKAIETVEYKRDLQHMMSGYGNWS